MTTRLPTDAETARLTASLEWLRARTCPTVLAVSEALQPDFWASEGRTSQHAPPWHGEHARSEWREARTAIVLPGSFNPLHAAHLLLLEAAAEAMPTPRPSPPPVAAFSLSVHTIDKAHPSGMTLEDRAWTMNECAASLEGAISAVALVASHGLYLDQAAALHDAMPHLEPGGLWFAIGYDKAVQIFDARYYTGRQPQLHGHTVRPRRSKRPTGAGERHDHGPSLLLTLILDVLGNARERASQK